MSSSAHEFILALRAGAYLRITQWNDFLFQRYPECKTAAADALLPVSVFELLQTDLQATESDLKQLSTLYTILMHPDRPFREAHDYAATTFFNAALQALVYRSKGLDGHFLSEADLTPCGFPRIIQRMDSQPEGWGTSQNTDALLAQYRLIEDRASVSESRGVIEGILKVLKLRNIAHAYRDMLALYSGSDLNTHIRKGLLETLTGKLDEETDAAKALALTRNYADMIEKQSPGETEKPRLCELRQLNTMDRCWDSFRFFTLSGVSALITSQSASASASTSSASSSSGFPSQETVPPAWPSGMGSSV